MKKKCFLSIIFIFIFVFVFVSFSLVHSYSLSLSQTSTVFAEENSSDRISIQDAESPLTGVCTLPLALASVASGLYIANRKSR